MTKKKLTYGKYLQLNKILDSQHLKSEENGNQVHDEMLFIIIHQAYELWFKQILHELDSVLVMFKGNYVQEENLGTVVSRFDRIIEIQKLLINQIGILETMTPMDFLEFRDLLTPASGFQSAQFRLIENKLGMQVKDRIKYGKQRYEKFLDDIDTNVAINQEELNELNEILNHLELLKRKYGGTISSVADYYNHIQSENIKQASNNEEIRRLDEELVILKKELKHKATWISRKRHEVALKLEKSISTGIYNKKTWMGIWFISQLSDY